MDTGRPDQPLNPQAPEGAEPQPAVQPPTAPAQYPPHWQMQPPPAVVPGQIVVDGQLLVPAGLWPRVAAFLLDAVILTILGQILATLTGFAASEDPQAFSAALMSFLTSGQMTDELQAVVDRAMAFNMLLTVMYAAYFTLFYAYAGTSLGKMALGLQVRRSDGAMLSLGHALLRYLAYWVSAKLLYTFFLIAFDREKRTLHDMLAKTNVYRVVPQPQRIV